LSQNVGVSPYDYFFQAPFVSQQAPFTRLTAVPGFNDFMTVDTLDDRLWELFRDSAVHCSNLPCLTEFRTEVSISWSIVPEPDSHALIGFGVVGVAILA